MHTDYSGHLIPILQFITMTELGIISIGISAVLLLHYF